MVRWTMKLLAMCVILAAGRAWAAALTPRLVDELRHGGYVLVMRHASSPTTLPDNSKADPENVAQERQLDGRTTAEAMGRL